MTIEIDRDFKTLVVNYYAPDHEEGGWPTESWVLDLENEATNDCPHGIGYEMAREIERLRTLVQEYRTRYEDPRYNV